LKQDYLKVRKERKNEKKQGSVIQIDGKTSSRCMAGPIKISAK
jgi:hypothetical protein